MYTTQKSRKKIYENTEEEEYAEAEKYWTNGNREQTYSVLLPVDDKLHIEYTRINESHHYQHEHDSTASQQQQLLLIDDFSNSSWDKCIILFSPLCCTVYVCVSVFVLLRTRMPATSCATIYDCFVKRIAVHLLVLLYDVAMSWRLRRSYNNSLICITNRLRYALNCRKTNNSKRVNVSNIIISTGWLSGIPNLFASVLLLWVMIYHWYASYVVLILVFASIRFSFVGPFRTSQSHIMMIII